MKEIRLVKVNYVQGFGFQATEEVINEYLSDGWTFLAVSGSAVDGIVVLEREAGSGHDKSEDVPTIDPANVILEKS